MAVITAADAAAAAHEPVIQSAVDDWHSLQLMRLGEFPEAGRPVDPGPLGKLGPLSSKKQKSPSWKDQSPTLRQVKKNENVLEQTRDELLFQQEERKKDKAAHEAKCEEYEKTIRHLKAEVIPLKRERDDLGKQVESLQRELEDLRSRLTEFALQLLQWGEPQPSAFQKETDSAPAKEPDTQAPSDEEPATAEADELQTAVEMA
jgi:chromosome segregation ATPase